MQYIIFLSKNILQFILQFIYIIIYHIIDGCMYVIVCFNLQNYFLLFFSSIVTERAINSNNEKNKIKKHVIKHSN